MQSSVYKYFIVVGALLMMADISQVRAQDRCGTVEILKNLRGKRAMLETDDQFEQWLEKKIALLRKRTNAAGIYQVPVVVHVIHRGEAVGSGTNLSDAQILSQIKVLNKDFNRMNTDASNTPSEFQTVAGSMSIEFVLAKQSPEGTATSGIVRVKGTKNTWTVDDETTLKASSYWPAEDYLNIWVADIAGQILGYAQFPVSDLPGMEIAVNNRLTDGVVIDYAVFGSSDDGAFSLATNYAKGRTTTHEVGHFLGLRHIWGDDSGACGGEGDYVTDTPDQGEESTGCPSHPQTSCSVRTMFQNYMDYTNDACMNLFTAGQVARMETVIENSPRRASLLNSPGLIEALTVANDLSLYSIVTPQSGVCSGAIIPTVVLKNVGTNAVTSAKLMLRIEGTAIETKTVVFDTPLASLTSANISFAALPLNAGTFAVDFEVLEANGVTDGNDNNNEASISVTVPYAIDLPFTESFAVMPSTWSTENADGGITWAVKTATQENSSNTAAYMNFYQYQNSDGQTDILFTPSMDLTHAEAPFLFFDVAYAQYSGRADGLKIYVVTDCGRDVSSGTEVYSKTGSTLATTTYRAVAFTPSGESQWRKEIVDLRAFIGQSNVRLAFVGVNDGGNNLYIDNVSVVLATQENVALTSIISPAPVRCTADVEPVIAVYNNGSVAITALKVQYAINGSEAQAYTTADDFNLPIGDTVAITLPSVTLADGANTISFTVTEPNGFTDVDTSDNAQRMSFHVNDASDIIPLRETFDDDTYQDRWLIVNPSEGMLWEAVRTNYNQSLYFNAAGNTTPGDEAWLVSPSLDFSNVVEASVFFDLSYFYTDSGNKKTESGDRLRILASTDCGNTYPYQLYDGSGEALSTGKATAGTPSHEGDWARHYFNLTSLAGNDAVRLAFVVNNRNANDLYIDNIEFFLSDNPSPQTAEEPFIVYGTDQESPRDFYVTFNLEERQPVVYNLVDVMGRTVAAEDLADVLNQTYRIDAAQVSAGIYFLRLQIGKAFYTTKVSVGN